MILAIFHYILGGLATAALVPFGLFTFHLFELTGEVFADPVPDDFTKATEIYATMIGYTAAIIVAAALALTTARLLQRRHGYRFIFAVACLECFGFPFGTVLGVFTLVVLLRPSVKQLFGGNVKL
jgi:hypothetical protein